jgi:hypothetical protein
VTVLYSLKIDVDTHQGMAMGVPRLLDCLARHHLRATFFLSLGPDRSGRALLQLRSPRFVRKMFATNAPSLYGWRTILSGTLLPARPIATAFPDLVRRLEAEGHEAAVHAWDHRAWQDELPSFKPRRLKAHFDRAVAAYRALTGHDPAGIGAPAWMTTPASLAMQDRYPFAYASDLRASPACRLELDGRRLRLPQFPGTGPCLEELLGLGLRGETTLAEALFAGLATEDTPLRVLTLHAEVEGGPFLGVLERLLPRLGGPGTVVTMGEAAARLSARLPVRRWCHARLPGRAFPVSSSRPLPAKVGEP